MKVMRYILMIILSISCVVAYAQDNGAIYGVVTDENGNPAIGAKIEVFSGGIKIGDALTNIDGEYGIVQLAAGEYETVCSYGAYKNIRTTHISVSNDDISTVYMTFDPHALEEKVIIYKKKPVLSSSAKMGTVFICEDIDLTKLVATSAAIQDSAYNGGTNNEPRGAMKGKVTDRKEKPVKHATIKAYLENKEVQEVKTNRKGEYELTGLSLGRYEILIAHRGYKKTRISQIDIRNDRVITVNGVLTRKNDDHFYKDR